MSRRPNWAIAAIRAVRAERTRCPPAHTISTSKIALQIAILAIVVAEAAVRQAARVVIRTGGAFAAVAILADRAIRRLIATWKVLVDRVPGRRGTRVARDSRIHALADTVDRELAVDFSAAGFGWNGPVRQGRRARIIRKTIDRALTCHGLVGGGVHEFAAILTTPLACIPAWVDELVADPIFGFVRANTRDAVCILQHLFPTACTPAGHGAEHILRPPSEIIAVHIRLVQQPAAST